MSICQHLLNYREVSTPLVIYKEECSQCFDGQDTEQGVYICLHCFNPGCDLHGQMHASSKTHPVALNITRQEVPNEPPAKIAKLAIGVPGGADGGEQQYIYHYRVFCFTCKVGLDIGDPEITNALSTVVASIITADSGANRDQLMAWEEDPIVPCQHTRNLVQEPTCAPLSGKALAHCNECSINNNMWLCLACGHLGCGRKNYDGSGGNNHAVDHFESTGHGVVCKIGTITAEGKADIYCYTCDNSREDPQLASHLASFGINVSEQKRTVKSTAELNLEMNLKFDFSMTTLDGKPLEPIYGKGLTGLENLGNSCYMASVLQSVMALPSFCQAYDSGSQMNNHRKECKASNHVSCFHCQMEKLAEGLQSGKYSTPRKSLKTLVFENNVTDPNETKLTPEEEDRKCEMERGQLGIRPLMFKSLIGRNHPDFASMQQQDAFDFFMYFCAQIEQQERQRVQNDPNFQLPTRDFEYIEEQRLRCASCDRVKYSTSVMKSLSVPMICHPNPAAPAAEKENETTSRKNDGKAPPKHIAFFDESVAAAAADEEVQFFCSNCKATSLGFKHSRMQTSPRVLILHAKRFEAPNWVPKKLDVDFKIPEEIDLTSILAGPKNPNEQLLEDVAENQKSSAPKFDEGTVSQLESMGFPRVRCEKAVIATSNTGAESAMNWLMEHMEDPDIDVPFSSPPSSSATGKQPDSAPEDFIMQLGEMGFTRNQAKKALKETSNNLERAVDWLFSHPDETGEDVAASNSVSSSSASSAGDTNPPKYSMYAFVTHKGPSVHTGHYVAHVKRDGKWVFFNDNKVAVDTNPNIGAGYLYFFMKRN